MKRKDQLSATRLQATVCGSVRMEVRGFEALQTGTSLDQDCNCHTSKNIIVVHSQDGEGMHCHDVASSLMLTLAMSVIAKFDLPSSCRHWRTAVMMFGRPAGYQPFAY